MCSRRFSVLILDACFAMMIRVVRCWRSSVQMSCGCRLLRLFDLINFSLSDCRTALIEQMSVHLRLYVMGTRSLSVCVHIVSIACGRIRPLSFSFTELRIRRRISCV